MSPKNDFCIFCEIGLACSKEAKMAIGSKLHSTRLVHKCDRLLKGQMRSMFLKLINGIENAYVKKLGKFSRDPKWAH